jgi:hypothetical protein
VTGAFPGIYTGRAPLAVGRRVRWAAVLLATGLAALLVCAATAGAAPPPPAELEVQGGEDAWHPDPAFRLRWVNPTPVAAVHYRVRDPLGAVAVPEQRLGWPASEIVGLQVPPLPGAYTAEVWLEDGSGQLGAAATAKLRFDAERPASIDPLPGAAWIGRAGFPFVVRLEHPAGAPPLSGIRGYAISIDAAPAGDPCAATDRCSDEETDLHGGAGNDTLPIADLPEGTSYVHAVAVSGSGMKSAAPGRAVLRVDRTDPVTELSGAPAGWTDHPVALTATATDAGSGMAPEGSGPRPFTAIRIDGATPVTAPGDSVSTEAIAEGSHTVAYYARDLAGNVDDGGASNGIPNAKPRLATIRIDRGTPSVAFANSQDPLDPELIEARVSDPLSGPDPDRGWIGIRRAGSGDPFSPLPALAPGAAALRARWDSDAYPRGGYELQATAYDRAGNEAVTRLRANGAAMDLTNPLKVTTSLVAGFGGRAPANSSRRTAPYGRTVTLSGRLTSGGDDPLPSVPVRIVERFAGGATGGLRVSTVPSDAEGRFSIRLAPGPSREVTAAFDGSPTLTRATGRPLSLAVRTGIRLRASSTVAKIGGAPLVFRGGIAAAPGTIPPGGVPVQLQFRLAGLPWSEFRTIQTDRRGRFRYAYRFSDDDSRGAVFQFRAYVPAHDGWPYEPGGSLPVVVRGR